MNPEPLRIHHSTAARHSQDSVNDVIRLVATEHIGNKYSLRESGHFISFKWPIASMY